MARVLVVEDDIPIATLLKDHLDRAGHAVRVVHDGREAIEAHHLERADLILLDLMLPSMSGFDVCRAIRMEAHAQPLILMLTARVAEEDSILGYELGADDYVRKPFGVRELMARIEAMLRLVERHRTATQLAPTDAPVVHGRLRLDALGRSALVDETALRLTPMEFDMLLYLARRSGTVLSREQLLGDVWGYTHAGYMRTVDSHVTRVRRKLAEAGLTADVLRTVHGVGYVFQASGLEPGPRK
jgi:DNA-binding response OmpR family regulator